MVSPAVFAKNLQALLDKKQKTRQDVCLELGIKYSTLSNWLNPNNKDRLPRIETIFTLCQYFSVNINDLIDDSVMPRRNKARRIPYFDSIKCGYPVNYVDGNFDTYIDCPDNVSATFAVKADGDSMNGLGILEGDTVFIKEQNTFEDGEVMAVCLGDSVVLKKCYHFEDGVRLKSVNIENKYADQIYSAKQLEDKTAHIIGKLVACLKKF